MSENEIKIKPVAWTVEEQLGKVAAGEIGFIAEREMIAPAADIPLYDQAAIDRLKKLLKHSEMAAEAEALEVDRRGERIDRLTAERDALRADAERWRHARRLFDYECIEDAQESYESFGRIVIEGACRRADIAIDAARAQEPQA